ncbi:hypothetical protein DK058_25180, partial [Salmonella enterica subsp. enterica serovar Typhi]|nr:hypothetical protein [Salmonella enterica subsp. enterica serovar Typhi]
AHVDLSDPSQIGGYEASTVTGNVITENDVAQPGTVVTKVDGVDVNASGDTTIAGQHGTLTIHADGSYSYTPNEDGSGIGQVETFQYTIQDAHGHTDTATLYIDIDSPGQGLVWTDPTQPATVNMVADDDTGAAVIDSAYAEDAGGPTGSGTASIAGNPFSGTTATVTRTFTVGANDLVDMHFGATSPDVALMGDTLKITITGSNGFSQTLNGTSSGLFGGLGIDQVLNDLAPGNYTVTATYVRPGGSLTGGTLSLSFDGVTTTHTDEIVASATHPATGNVLSDDTLASPYTHFQVDNGSGTFVDVTNGTTVVGDHGTLTINSDGSYSYTPTADLAGIGTVDIFTYQLVHPNGTVDQATLTIDLDNGSG